MYIRIYIRVFYLEEVTVFSFQTWVSFIATLCSQVGKTVGKRIRDAKREAKKRVLFPERERDRERVVSAMAEFRWRRARSVTTGVVPARNSKARNCKEWSRQGVEQQRLRRRPLLYPRNKLQSQITESNSFGVRPPECRNFGRGEKEREGRRRERGSRSDFFQWGGVGRNELVP